MTPPRPAPPDSVAVRLDVRVGSGRAVGYPMTAAEFRIGGAAGCDVRLPGAHVPPLVCQLARTPDGLSLRRLDPAFPVLLNAAPVTGTDPVRVANGDRLAVGPADVTVSLATAHLRPQFVPLSTQHSVLSTPAPPTPDDPVAAERAELAELRARLEEQARELEADRVLWYRRRAEIEAEGQRVRDQSPALTAREQELAASRDELATLRQNLFDQYRERRDQLAQMQEVVQGATAALDERRRELDDRERLLAERLAETPAERDLSAREEQVRQDRAALAEERERHAADYVRLDRWQSSLADRQATLDRRAAEVDERFDQLRRDTVELEDQVRLADAEQGRLGSETGRLDKLRTDLESRANHLAERSAQLEAQQAMLAVLRSRLDRQQEEARQAAVALAADRARQHEAQRELDDRLREAERLRAELTTARDGHTAQEKLAGERLALLEATLAEIQQQKDALGAEQARLQQKETELDARSAEIAEQTAVMKARLEQVMDLQERLGADRTAVREREVTLADADTARQTFQEQLRRRAEELSARSRQFDETGRRLADEKAELDRLRAEVTAEREQVEGMLATRKADLDARTGEVDRRTVELTDRETALERQVARLREVGRAVAAARKELSQSRAAWEADRRDVEALRARAAEELSELRREAPDLEDRARGAVERLTAARDVLRGHLGELNAFAGLTRDELRAEADRLRDREQQLDRAKAEHRLAVTEFRQQLLGWQAQVGELKQLLARGESRLDARKAEVDAAALHADAAALDLARQADELRRERLEVAERRTEVERHLSEMREWYRTKLRDLAAERGAIAGRIHPAPAEDVDPGDKQLGELLRSLELIDAEALAGLWAEANRQRRTLRHVLLASGAVTLYQLALIEAGNLDALMLGPFRVVERLRVMARETVYRVHDPVRGVCQLRHLSETEAEDAVRPDEFRQRFTAARQAAHPNLANTFDVLDVQNRPAALQEWVAGLPSADWPGDAAVPGVWVRLTAAVAAGLEAAHRAGLAHGRLTADAVVLTPTGDVKLLGVGDPPWLAGGSFAEPTQDADLRALGQVAFGWAQLAGRRRGRKGFPESLTAVVRRLEADPETPMADTASGAVPYRSAAELVADLNRLGGLFPCPEDAWEALVRQAADRGAEESAPLRQSA